LKGTFDGLDFKCKYASQEFYDVFVQWCQATGDCCKTTQRMFSLEMTRRLSLECKNYRFDDKVKKGYLLSRKLIEKAMRDLLKDPKHDFSA